MPNCGLCWASVLLNWGSMADAGGIRSAAEIKQQLFPNYPNEQQIYASTPRLVAQFQVGNW